MEINELDKPSPTWDWDEYDKWLKGQIIPNPPDHLREIYEKRVLTELSYLRAEKYDSPEHQVEVAKMKKENPTGKIPRNIQNPNFDTLLKYYEGLKNSKNTEESLATINELKNFLEKIGTVKPFKYQPAIFKRQIDSRACEDLGMYFNYHLTRTKQSQSKTK